MRRRLRRFALLNRIAWVTLTAPVDSPQFRRLDRLMTEYLELAR